MPQHRLNNYDGGVMLSDTANTPDSVMERDSNGQANASTFNASTRVVVGGVMDIKGLAITGSITADSSVTFYEGNATAGAIVVTLPPVATVPGRVFVVTKTDNSVNAVGFKGNGAENIDGANTKNTTTQYTSVRVRANQGGTAWYSF